jgi:hypothetical protein
MHSYIAYCLTFDAAAVRDGSTVTERSQRFMLSKFLNHERLLLLVMAAAC